MLANLLCGALHGISAYRVDLEVDLVRQGLPNFTLVGLGDGAVKEAKERVLAALRSCNFRLPPSKITVNLAPADRRKYGAAYDLPIAIGLLVACEVLQTEQVKDYFFAGELSLGGKIRPVPGILPLTMLARAEQASAVIVSESNAYEAAIVKDMPVYGFDNLQDVVAFLRHEQEHTPLLTTNNPYLAQPEYILDFAEVKGQEHAKRAIEISAAGAHNLLFIGPPGSGKTMLAQRIPSVLPPLAFDEALEVTKIYSVASLLPEQGLMVQRPFRSPHHTISQIALVGGGISLRPGEVSLAHNGVLFLDEMPEYQKQALEVLRQPLEDGEVTISRASGSMTFPAQCMLVGAMNPCPCGYQTDPRHTCTCSPQQIERYRAKLSGPLLDRIDLHVEVPAVSFEDLQNKKSGSTSSQMRERILAARRIQDERYQNTSCRTNADLSGSLLEEFCSLGKDEYDFLRKAVQKLALSARAYTRILRISRTIADLEQAEYIKLAHLAEAINCRTLDRERL